MPENTQKRSSMKRNQFLALFIIIAIVFIFISGCAGVSRIDSFFANEEYKQHAKLIDFSLFFVMFFALSYLGLTQVWGKGFGKPGEGKGAIVGLSLALALSLAFALITQTRFSITTIFPIAKALLFLIIFFILWGLLVMSKMFGDHWGGKLVAAILALIATYLLACIATHMICQMSDNMDDPACQSDFFNWLFNVLGRLFGVENWTWSDSSGGSGGWFSSRSGRNWFTGSPGPDWTPQPSPVPTPTPQPIPTGPIQGGCRLDITFDFDSTNILSSAPIANYVSKVKGKKIYVYGFASPESELGGVRGERYNLLLSGRRADTIVSMIKSADPSAKVSSSSRGPTSVFDPTNPANYPPNRRVVLATESISSFYPAPNPGTLNNCEDLVSDQCGNGVVDPGETCDPGRADSCPEDQKCSDDCKKCESDGGFPWWWLFALLPLLLLLLLKRKKKVDVVNVLVRKDRFLVLLKSIWRKKQIIQRDIRAFYGPGLTPADLDKRAWKHVEDIELDLKESNWKPIKQLAIDYKKPKDIAMQGIPFVGEKQAKEISELVAEMKKRHSPADKDFARNWDEATFYSHLKDVVKDKRSAIHPDFHKFFVLEERLKRAIEKFKESEEKVLVKMRERHYTTFAGKRNVGTRHIVRKKGFPWVTTHDEIVKAEEQEVIPSSTHGIVKVTRQVIQLCDALDAQIDAVLAEQPNVSNNASSCVDFHKKVDVEFNIIKALINAIKYQKLAMTVNWYPCIANFDVNTGKMEGHVHFKMNQTR